MPKVYPFRALRSTSDFVLQVSAKSTDFKSQNLLVDELKSNPFTFHHVTKNHLNYSGAYQEPEKFLPFAAKFLTEMKRNKILVKEEKESFYFYEQQRLDGKIFKGLIALCDIEDYRSNKIKKHEEIRPSRLKFLVELFKTTKVMGEPTLLAYAGNIQIPNEHLHVIFNFTSIDGKHHKISRLDNIDEVKNIQKQFKNIEAFYIADGHHRSASVEEFNAKYPELDNRRSMCLLMSETDLEIKPFQRLIKSVNKIEKEILLNALRVNFEVTKVDKPLYDPKKHGEFGLYLKNEWYKLATRNPRGRMDIVVLEEDIVKEVFGIQDSRTDSQISFHPHTEGLTTLVNLVDSETFDVAITNKPCTFKEVRKISDLGNVMPAKSTFIEPKLRAGLIIQEF